MILICYLRHQEFVNEETSYNDTCYKCGKCGRKFDENGMMVQQAKNEKKLEWEE
jgi:DNA-directed RNA polymerase subunit RPC12/RpoP